MSTILPSGKQVINLWNTNKASSEASSDGKMEATAGSMSLDVEGQCPKCQMQMGIALAYSEEVYYCDNCRVSLPMPVSE